MTPLSVLTDDEAEALLDPEARSYTLAAAVRRLAALVEPPSEPEVAKALECVDKGYHDPEVHDDEDCCTGRLVRAYRAAQASLDQLYGKKFSERCYQAISSRASQAEAAFAEAKETLQEQKERIDSLSARIFQYQDELRALEAERETKLLPELSGFSARLMEMSERAEKAEAERDALMADKIATFNHTKSERDRLKAELEAARKALAKLAGPGGCGCKPKCVCVETLAGALAVTASMREFASDALASLPAAGAFPCGCEDGQHEPDCPEHHVNRCLPAAGAEPHHVCNEGVCRVCGRTVLPVAEEPKPCCPHSPEFHDTEFGCLYGLDKQDASRCCPCRPSPQSPQEGA